LRRRWAIRLARASVTARFRLSCATEAGNETLTNGEFAVGALLRSRKLGAEAPHNERVERKQNGERDDDDGT
jgi:hypothetical protein